ncbi:MAG: hypothetical protein KatS3mg111_3063 [Pirellulaceae bacterium]|nr:MAG: hypothetical protein KatS3mg111_3063 [Pirellulaceae bacterium]
MSTLSELVLRMIGDVGQRVQVAGIGQLVDVQDRVALVDQVADQVRADKTGSPGDQDAALWSVRSHRLVSE